MFEALYILLKRYRYVPKSPRRRWEKNNDKSLSNVSGKNFNHYVIRVHCILNLKLEEVPKPLFLPLHFFLPCFALCVLTFMEKIRMKMKRPLRWPGSQPAWPGRTLCVCVSVYSPLWWPTRTLLGRRPLLGENKTWHMNMLKLHIKAKNLEPSPLNCRVGGMRL